jgi:hypothetical protein
MMSITTIRSKLFATRAIQSKTCLAALPLMRRRLSSSKGTPPFERVGPIPLGNAKEEQEMQRLIKQKEKEDMLSNEPVTPADGKLESFPDNKNPETGEIDGPKGPEPTRYGDWERKGRVYDF